MTDSSPHKNLPFLTRLRFALQGFSHATRERSFCFQVFCGIGAVVLLWLTQPKPIWWVVTLQMIGTVLGFELANTALEILCDFVEPKYHPQIKKAKDCAAAAVLVNAIISLWVLGVLLWEWRRGY